MVSENLINPPLRLPFRYDPLYENERALSEDGELIRTNFFRIEPLLRLPPSSPSWTPADSYVIHEEYESPAVRKAVERVTASPCVEETWPELKKKKYREEFNTRKKIRPLSLKLRFNEESLFLLVNHPKPEKPKGKGYSSQEESEVKEIEEREIILGEVVQKGGFGIVYKALWRKPEEREDNNNNNFLEREVAVKVLAALSGKTDEDLEKEFIQELEIMKRLNHPNVVKVLGYSKIPSQSLRMIMEFASKGSLRDFLKRGPLLSLPRKFSLAKEILSGLAYLHSKRFLHRDVESGNILLGGDFTAKICDFGLSKIKHLTSTTTSSFHGGTLVYAAPEIFEGEKNSFASDIYSISLVLWEIFFGEGRTPFEKVPRPALYATVVFKKLRPPLPTFSEAEEEENLHDNNNYHSPLAGVTDLINEGWSHEPSERPTAELMLRSLESISLKRPFEEEEEKEESIEIEKEKEKDKKEIALQHEEAESENTGAF